MTSRVTIFLTLAVAILLTGCVTPLPKRPGLTASQALKEVAAQPQSADTFQAKVTIQVLWLEFPMLVAGARDHTNRTLSLTALSTTGAFIFSGTANADGVTQPSFSPMLPNLVQRPLQWLLLDFYNVWFADHTDAKLRIRHGRAEVSAANLVTTYAGTPLTPWLKCAYSPDGRLLWSWRRLSREGNNAANTWRFHDRQHSFNAEVTFLSDEL